VSFSLDDRESTIEIRASARVEARTGVEMEALAAVTVAALTIYDMCKAVDRGMRITDIRLTSKSGGRSGSYEAA
jgi:cyclic pyranopterin phosphate synthase